MQQFVLVTETAQTVDWLKGVLPAGCEMVLADLDAHERVLQLVDAVNAPLVFVEFSNQQLQRQINMVQRLLTTKPLLTVIALGTGAEQSVLLAALRAGARDFIAIGAGPGDVDAVIQRLRERLAPDRPGRRTGQVLTLLNARPDANNAIIAMHLAMALQREGRQSKVLLLDLGLPYGDSLLVLGLKASYSFVDALRSVRRFDDTLIETAFVKHDSGISLLSMPDDGAEAQVTAADIVALLGILRNYFSHIVVNLGGNPHVDFVQVFASHADLNLLLVEQTIPSCKHNKALLGKLSNGRTTPLPAGLVVDSYLKTLQPRSDELAAGMGVELFAVLPPSGLARLSVLNTGRTLFEVAARDPFTLGLRKLARRVLEDRPGLQSSPAQTASHPMVRLLRSMLRSTGT